MSTRTMTTRTFPMTTTPTTPTPAPTTLHTHLATTTTTTNPLSNASASDNANDSRPTPVAHTLLHTMHTQAQSISWRLRQYCTQAIAASSRRRRRRRDDINDNNNNNNITNCNSSNCNQSNSNNNNSFACSTPSCAALPEAEHYYDHNNNSNSYTSNNNNNNSIFSRRGSNSNLSKTTTATSSPAIQLLNTAVRALSSSSKAASYIAALLVLTTLCSFCAASPCDLHSWWDPLKDKCITCTVCEGDLIPLRPCQLHRDTICGSIYDLKIDWVVLAKTEPNWKERRKDDANIEFEQQLSHEELQQLQDESLAMDWQTTALFLAVLACLLFFIVAAGILVHHMRQWRRMERRLDQDVEELSTKLMAKLAEVQSMEGGTFFIGNADALGVPTTFQPQHVLLPEKPAKHHERRILKTLQPGNVYIEENGSKG
ncbi:tumor necrosis factor receptor superfamily member wengen isoform X2 [Anastrepha ludens]|nr:tumor necrosis factor receptor superfamily member wengen isoform X2 [Anastrepha ludens]XP_053950742.1 tumor necrosis factor receptor superfamily member wengen isoform X2 [Anastrepha ludens]